MNKALSAVGYMVTFILLAAALFALLPLIILSLVLKDEPYEMV